MKRPRDFKQGMLRKHDAAHAGAHPQTLSSATGRSLAGGTLTGPTYIRHLTTETHTTALCRRNASAPCVYNLEHADARHGVMAGHGPGLGLLIAANWNARQHRRYTPIHRPLIESQDLSILDHHHPPISGWIPAEGADPACGAGQVTRRSAGLIRCFEAAPGITLPWRVLGLARLTCCHWITRCSGCGVDRDPNSRGQRRGADSRLFSPSRTRYRHSGS